MPFDFYKHSTTAADDIDSYKKSHAYEWQKKGERMAIDLFHFTAKNVSAYAQFLKDNEVTATNVKTIEDFKKIPFVTKDNYLRPAEYALLFPKDGLTHATTIAATSGSTGEPFFFPRGPEQDKQYERLTEIFLRNQFGIDKKKTLGIIGFGLGIWIGGIFTYKNLNRIAENGYDLTLIPASTQKELYLKAFKKFAPLYDQIILMGYPPFIKDLLDSGGEHGINWHDHDLKILTAAEGYSENFRNHIAEKAGIKNIVNDIVNIYGTVEQGTIAHETALGNLIRRLAESSKPLFKKLFRGATNMPTLAQYYPHEVFFEEIDGKIVATAYGSSIPLVRYSFGDLGGVWSFDDMMSMLEDEGIDIMAEAKKWGIDDKILKLPFVYVYARSDFSITFRGANIYPDEIRTALDGKQFDGVLTGRFTLIKKEDGNHNHLLEINAELANGTKLSKEIEQLAQAAIVAELCSRNSEFKNEYVSHPEKATPRVVLWPYHDPLYFHGGGKQAWVKKT
jgi:phenylacetate-CoA ligase